MGCCVRGRPRSTSGRHPAGWRADCARCASRPQPKRHTARVAERCESGTDGPGFGRERGNHEAGSVDLRCGVPLYKWGPRARPAGQKRPCAGPFSCEVLVRTGDKNTSESGSELRLWCTSGRQCAHLRLCPARSKSGLAIAVRGKRARCTPRGKGQSRHRRPSRRR